MKLIFAPNWLVALLCWRATVLIVPWFRLSSSWLAKVKSAKQLIRRWRAVWPVFCLPTLLTERRWRPFSSNKRRTEASTETSGWACGNLLKASTKPFPITTKTVRGRVFSMNSLNTNVPSKRKEPKIQKTTRESEELVHSCNRSFLPSFLPSSPSIALQCGNQTVDCQIISPPHHHISTEP